MNPGFSAHSVSLGLKKLTQLVIGPDYKLHRLQFFVTEQNRVSFVQNFFVVPFRTASSFKSMGCDSYLSSEMLCFLNFDRLAFYKSPRIFDMLNNK